MSTTEIFLLAMLIAFAVPCLVWRLGRTDYVAPLVIVQLITRETLTALLLMAVGSTMLTVPVVHPKPDRARHRGLVNQAGA